MSHDDHDDDLDTSRRLRSALEPTDTDHTTADRLVDDVLDRKAPGRQRPWLAPAVAAAGAAVLAGGVGLTSLWRDDAPDQVATPPAASVPAETPTAAPPPEGEERVADSPDHMHPEPGPVALTVRCTGSDIETDGAVVDAVATGVPLRLVNDTGRATTFQVRTDGDGVSATSPTPLDPGEARSIDAQLPPGTFSVSCTSTENTEMAVQLTVDDPHGLWLGGFAQADCPITSDALFSDAGRGATPQAAIANHAAGLVSPGAPANRMVTAQRLSAGYPDAVEQYWVRQQQGGGRTLMVVRATDDGYTARPYGLCG